MKTASLSKFDLRDFLNKRTYDHAVICSFTFDTSFFEEYCLEKLSTLSNNKNITVFIDQNHYQEILDGGVSQRPNKANLHYLLYPISVTGVFHPKILLLASKNKGKLIIGSANLTRSGMTSNAELVGVYEYETEKNEQYKSLFQEAFNYILQLSRIYESKNVSSNINEIVRDVEWLTFQEEFENDHSNLLIHNLEEPLWNQLIRGINTPVDKV